MSLSAGDRKEIEGLSRAAAVEVMSKIGDGIFKRINDDRKYSLNQINSIVEKVFKTAEVQAALVSRMESHADIPPRVQALEVEVAKFPGNISEATDDCSQKHEKKKQWSIGTMISILATAIAFWALVVSLKACKEEKHENTDSGNRGDNAAQLYSSKKLRAQHNP